MEMGTAHSGVGAMCSMIMICDQNTPSGSAFPNPCVSEHSCAPASQHYVSTPLEPFHRPWGGYTGSEALWVDAEGARAPDAQGRCTA